MMMMMMMMMMKLKLKLKETLEQPPPPPTLSCKVHSDIACSFCLSANHLINVCVWCKISPTTTGEMEQSVSTAKHTVKATTSSDFYDDEFP